MDKSFFLYRLPRENKFFSGVSDRISKGLFEPGFAIRQFLPESEIILIPFNVDEKSPVPDGFDFTITGTPIPSTTKLSHTLEVETIKESIDSIKGGKTVAARIIREDGFIDVKESFLNLCRKFPDAYVFAFSTPITGCWIGASPELLLEASEQNGLSTVALAGTRPAGTAIAWDIKNIREQKTVTDYITEVLHRHGLNPSVSPRYTVAAGNVEHLCNSINSKHIPSQNLNNLLKELAPTPAVCGFPKNTALKLIDKLEDFPRECYGGFCGLYRNDRNFCLSVILRCAKIYNNGFNAYAGGGITSLSDAANEWEETEMKSRTVIESLVFKQ